MVDAGLLEGAPVELLEGVLVEVGPQGPEHGFVIAVLDRYPVPRLPEPWVLLPQSPLAAGPSSMPEPDSAVVADVERGFRTTTALAVEVAVSGRRDLSIRARACGGARVAAYRVVDVPRRQVVVHTAPRDDGCTSVVAPAVGRAPHRARR